MTAQPIPLPDPAEVPTPEPSPGGEGNSSAVPTTGGSTPAIKAPGQSNEEEPRPAIGHSLTARTPLDAVPSSSSREGHPPKKEVTPTQAAAGDPHEFDVLRWLAETHDDAQRARIAIENRLRSKQIASDAGAPILAACVYAEDLAAKAMRQQFKRAAPEIAAWTKATVGLGDQLMARLIGSIGHPRIARPHHWEGDGEDRKLIDDAPFERNVAKLWAYCGVGDPSRKKAKGMTAEDAAALGNPTAKMLVRLVAEGCMKQIGGEVKVRVKKKSGSQSDRDTHGTSAAGPDVDGHSRPDAQNCGAVDNGEEDADASSTPATRIVTRPRSPYRDLYDYGKAKYADREGWTPAHQHSAALRLVSKAVLKDLWKISQP